VTDFEKIAWTAATSLAVVLVTTLIVGIVRAIARRRKDALSLKAELAVVGDLDVLATIGCPGLVLWLSCLGARPAKIKGAALCLVGDDLLAAFQKGFGTDFGYRPPPSGADRKQTLVIGLLPLSPTNVLHGYVIERDEVCKFMLPLFTPGLLRFAQAPSEDVSVRIQFLDGHEQTVLRGLSVQSQIDALIRVYGSGHYQLRPGVTLPISIRAVSAAPPDPSAVGRINPNPVRLVDDANGNDA